MRQEKTAVLLLLLVIFVCIVGTIFLEGVGKEEILVDASTDIQIISVYQETGPHF